MPVAPPPSPPWSNPCDTDCVSVSPSATGPRFADQGRAGMRVLPFQPPAGAPALTVLAKASRADAVGGPPRTPPCQAPVAAAVEAAATPTVAGGLLVLEVRGGCGFDARRVSIRAGRHSNLCSKALRRRILSLRAPCRSFPSHHLDRCVCMCVCMYLLTHACTHVLVCVCVCV